MRTRKALSSMTAGEELLVECTDPMTAIDIPNMVRETGNTLLEQRDAAEIKRFHIRKE